CMTLPKMPATALGTYVAMCVWVRCIDRAMVALRWATCSLALGRPGTKCLTLPPLTIGGRIGTVSCSPSPSLLAGALIYGPAQTSCEKSSSSHLQLTALLNSPRRTLHFSYF